MCLIAKNEREHVRECLTSFAEHVDEIVFVDTGSRDGTVAELRQVCRQHGWTSKLVLGRFRWRDDQAAARNYAESLASGEFTCHTDLDESVIGAEHLRSCCALLTPNIGSMNGANMLYFQCRYYGRWGWWQRLVRRGAFPWLLKVADPRPVRGAVGTVARDICHWVHRREWHQRPTDRWVRAARRWASEDPSSPQYAFELAYELLDALRPDEALETLQSFARNYPEARQELGSYVRLSPPLEALWSRRNPLARAAHGLHAR